MSNCLLVSQWNVNAKACCARQGDGVLTKSARSALSWPNFLIIQYKCCKPYNTLKEHAVEGKQVLCELKLYSLLISNKNTKKKN